MNAPKFGLAIALILASNIAHAACELPTASESDKALPSNYALSYQTVPAQIGVAEHFTLLITVCSSKGAPFTGELRADAHMPIHKHGMNYLPKVIKLGDGEFRAEGFMFHMPGHWQFKFDLKDVDHSEQLTRDYKIK